VSGNKKTYNARLAELEYEIKYIMHRLDTIKETQEKQQALIDKNKRSLSATLKNRT